MKLRIVLHVSKSADGTLTGTMDSVDQGANGIPFSSISETGGAVRFELKSIASVFEGTLDAEKSHIAGKWRQGGASLPLTFERTDKAIELNRPQEPKKPYPYNEEDVNYENKKAGVKLAGTLTWPRASGPFPTVLLITGSGPQDRNEALMGHKPFLVLSDYLTRRGIAVLRVDDRGEGGSTGSTMNSTSADFAGDVLTGIEFLKSRKEVNPAQIGLIGHSEGGLIAPMVAADSSYVAFIVMMAGPGMKGFEILDAQAAAIAKAMGASADSISQNRTMQEQMFAIVRSEQDPAAAEKKIREAWSKAMAQLPAEQQKARAGALDAQLKMVLSPWFRYFLDYDPAPALKKTKCPVLAIDGELDLQVPTGNLTKIAEALEAGGNTDFEIVKFPRLNHLFQTSKTGSPAEYAQIEETIAPVALETMTGWILRHTQKH